jgi:hypothetical protein
MPVYTLVGERLKGCRCLNCGIKFKNKENHMWHNKEEQQAEAYWQAQARFEKLERMKNKGWGEKPLKQSAEEFNTQGKAQEK